MSIVILGAKVILIFGFVALVYHLLSKDDDDDHWPDMRGGV